VNGQAKGVIIEQHTKICCFKIHPQGGLFVGSTILVITQNHSLDAQKRVRE